MATIKDKQAQAIKPGDKPLPAGITGLTLQPSSTKGRGKWNLRYVSPVTGKRRDMGLGVYPDVLVAKALADAQAARELIAAGQDPIHARAEQNKIPTFEEAARARWAVVAPGFRNAKHKAQWITSLEAHVFPRLGMMRVDSLTPKHFANMLRPIWLEIPETASRVKQRCADVMASCWAQGYIQANPLDVVEMLLPKAAPAERHHPAMPWRDVPTFVGKHLAAEPIMGARAALLFAILTAARSGEVRGMTWGEVDTDKRLWAVPAERMKAHRAHRVPLSDDALDLIHAQWHEDTPPPPDVLVFPSLRGKELSDMAMTSILRKAKAPSDAPGRTATAHGFRSSFRNWAADHGFSADIAERALAHTIGNKTQAAYERTDRLEARIKMMDQWAAHVMGRTGADVVPIRGAA